MNLSLGLMSVEIPEDLDKGKAAEAEAEIIEKKEIIEGK